MKKKIFTVIALLLTVSVMSTNTTKINAATAKSKEISVKICNSILKGQSSFTSHSGTAYSSISKRSYTTVTSTYTYVNGSNKVKTVDSDLTGAGDAAAATWKYSLKGSCYSCKIKSTHTAIVDCCQGRGYTTAA